MKKLFIIIGVILAIWFGIVQYRNYVRFHPPAPFDHAINDSIDAHYYNAQGALQYFQAVQEAGQIARNAWFEQGIDVRMQNPVTGEGRVYVEKYNQAHAMANFWERKLIASQQLKNLGFTNADIQFIEEKGATAKSLYAEAARVESLKWSGGVLKQGDDNVSVFRVQQLLKKTGKELPVDGYFEAITRASVETFQRENGLHVTGVINDLTLAVLYEKTKSL